MTWEDVYGGIVGEEDLHRLRVFVQTVDELLARRFFRAGSMGMLVEADAHRGVEFVSDHGDAEDFRSAMMTLRKLLMQNEASSVNRVVQILMRNEDDDERRELVRRSYAEIKAARKEPAEAVMGELRPDGGIPLTTGRSKETLLDEMFNKQLFHNDPAPTALPSMTDERFHDLDMNEMFLRHVVLEHAVSEAEFASWLAAFIKSKGDATPAGEPS